MKLDGTSQLQTGPQATVVTTTMSSWVKSLTEVTKTLGIRCANDEAHAWDSDLDAIDMPNADDSLSE